MRVTRKLIELSAMRLCTALGRPYGHAMPTAPDGALSVSRSGDGWVLMESCGKGSHRALTSIQDARQFEAYLRGAADFASRTGPLEADDGN